MNILYERMTELLFEGRDSNPHRLSKPENLPTFSYSGKWKQHKMDMEGVEKKRATRAKKKKFKDHLLAILRQSYGEDKFSI